MAEYIGQFIIIRISHQTSAISISFSRKCWCGLLLNSFKCLNNCFTLQHEVTEVSLRNKDNDGCLANKTGPPNTALSLPTNAIQWLKKMLFTLCSIIWVLLSLSDSSYCIMDQNCTNNFIYKCYSIVSVNFVQCSLCAINLLYACIVLCIN